MTESTSTPLAPLASFLLPEGFTRPSPTAVLREVRMVGEVGRYARRAVGERRTRRGRAYAGPRPALSPDPVVLVPGFMAGDASLTLMSRTLRARGFRTYRSHTRANIGCTLEAAAQLEARLESVVLRRGSRVQVIGHSLGGMIARGVAVRRPDLVSGIVTMGSPMLAPGAHHHALSLSIDLLVRLSDAGVPGLMSADCVAGACARESFEESRSPLPEGVCFTALWSRRDGIVDPMACIDPEATSVEVTSSHCGMAVDPLVIDQVTAALVRHGEAAVLPRLRIA